MTTDIDTKNIAVYLAIDNEQDFDHGISGIFSTEEKAIEWFKREYPNDYLDDERFIVEQWDVDDK